MTSRRALLREAQQALQLGHVIDPKREATWILADLEQVPPARLVIDSDVEVPAGSVGAFRHAVARRIAGEPLPYVTGRAAFRHLDLHVDTRVLIPRPETEGLVDLVLGAQCPPGCTVLDVGTGSGCLALALADEGRGRFEAIWGVDRSLDALAVARSNSVATGLPVTYLAGDMTAPIGDAIVGVLVSNPPYLTTDEYTQVDASVRRWEPPIALVGGGDGWEPYRALLDDGRRVLVPGGLLALEVDARRGQGVVEAAWAMGWVEVSLHTDLFGRDRYVTARWGQ